MPPPPLLQLRSYLCPYKSICLAEVSDPRALARNEQPSGQATTCETCSGLQLKGHCLALLVGLGDVLPLQLPVSHSKAQTLLCLSTPFSQTPNKTVTKHQLTIVSFIDTQGQLWRSLWSSRSKNPPQDWASTYQFPQPGRSLCKAGTQVRATSDDINLFQLSSQHLLLSFFSFLASLTVFWARPWFTLQPVPNVLPGLEESLSLHLYSAPVLTYVLYCDFLRL